MRCRQPVGQRGSLKWIQRAVASRPDLLQPTGLASIRWLSPLAEDNFAEYRDASFLERLGLGHLGSSLESFWPARGPQWDALGLAGDAPILVEAKAHLRELRAPASQAKPVSAAHIDAAFLSARTALGVAGINNWRTTYYQLTNRIAHLWWLRHNGINAHLVFINFINDSEMGGPTHAKEWRDAYETARVAIGLPRDHPLAAAIHHVEPDTSLLS